MDENMAPPETGPLLAILRLLLAVGLGLVLAGGVSTAAILLPEVTEDTIARIWIGIGLFGVVVAGLAAIGVYAVRAVGENRVIRWLRSSSQQPEERRPVSKKFSI